MQRESRLIPLCAATAAIAIHVALNPGYGFFRDELYFIICGRHPAFGYVDQPPLVPLLAALSQIFGISLIALRALAALFAGASIFVTCRIVQEFEGGPFAQIFAACAAFFAPILMGFGTQVSPDMAGLWLWPLAVLYLIRLVKGADPRTWLGVGIALGVAGNAKYSVLFFAFAIFAGLLLTRERRIVLTPWFPAAAALAALMLLPNFLWQAVHGFPMLELLRNGQHGKNVILTPAQYLLQQVFLLNPLLVLIPLVGLLWLALRAQWRWLAFAYLILMAAMIAGHGKDYYPADVYPYLIAAGAVAVEGWTMRARLLAQPLLVAYAVAAGALFAPFAMPVLPENAFIAYQAHVLSALHVKPMASEHHRSAAMGQDFADMHGWPQLAQTVASVYNSLPPDERARAVIVGSNYGEAAAVDFFGKRYGLPPAISGHNQYYLWGTHGYSGDVIIDVNGDCGAKDRIFRSSVRAAVFSAPYVMPYEDQMPIMVCRGIKKPLAKIWPAVKFYI
jgi:hypothetical protein